MNKVNESLVYLFHIKAKNAKEYHLTSATSAVSTGGAMYLPYSGLALKLANFNDSAENYIILQGVFEERGIGQKTDLIGSEIKIMHFKDNEARHIVTYICTQYLRQDLKFEIKCESEAIKYNQSLLQKFSKTCRANFGDDKCKIKLEEYAEQCDIVQVSGNVVHCNIQEHKGAYFKGGTMIVKDEVQGEYKFKIIAHGRDSVEIENNLKFDFAEQRQITLLPGCDKNFRTCCYSFKNAVNFRGEPTIPENNIIR